MNPEVHVVRTADGRLSEKLKAAGFHVARRTVAKYRALAAIPDAASRARADCAAN